MLVQGGMAPLRPIHVMIVLMTYRTDNTQTGHILGSPDSRTAAPAPERKLSPPAICIMRAIMHSALLWCSCHREDAIQDVANLIKPFVNPQHLQEYFWMHLQKDIEQLSLVSGKGFEESVITVHLVLSDILTKVLQIGMLFCSFVSV